MASAPAYTAIDEPNPSALLESRRRWREPLDEPPQYFVENQSWRPGDPPAPPRRDPAGAKSETVAATGVQALHPVTDMEGLGEQVRNLKKELAAARAENRLLKVGKERAEIELRRAELVTFFSQRVSPAVEPNELKQRISALGDGQGHLTEKAMAGMLRSYAVLVQ